jgi:hypothetical protein
MFESGLAMDGQLPTKKLAMLQENRRVQNRGNIRVATHSRTPQARAR